MTHANETPEQSWVSVARHTVMDGLCIDWYRSVASYEGHGHWVVSANRAGVLVDRDTYLHTVPVEILTSADVAYEWLRAGNREAAKRIATHADTGKALGRGKLAPVDAATEGGA